MFNLKANITLKGNDNKFINKREINRYIESICEKFAYTSDDLSLEDNYIKSFNMDFNIYKNKISCCIDCDSYGQSLQIAQGLLKLDFLNFMNYKFEVNSLELKELEKIDIDNRLAKFGSY